MEYSKALVTGGSGFIASHLQEELLQRGIEVVSVDAKPIEFAINCDRLLSNPNFHFTRTDVNNIQIMKTLCDDIDMVFHMASNTNIREGSFDPSADYINTFSSTHSILEVMRANNIKQLFFPSSSAVYGIREGALKEDDGDLRPISYYGAYKLACESMISSYCSMNNIDALIFRLPNVVGPGITHGIIYDLMGKIKSNNSKLEILGDGKQSKQYLYVKDAINAIINFSSNMVNGMDVFNISTDSSISVESIAKMICNHLDVNPVFEYTGGNSGWRGDVPYFKLDISKAKSKGWKYTLDSTAAVKKTIEEIYRSIQTPTTINIDTHSHPT